MPSTSIATRLNTGHLRDSSYAHIEDHCRSLITVTRGPIWEMLEEKKTLGYIIYKSCSRKMWYRLNRKKYFYGWIVPFLWWDFETCWLSLVGKKGAIGVYWYPSLFNFTLGQSFTWSNEWVWKSPCWNSPVTITVISAFIAQRWAVGDIKRFKEESGKC